MQTLAVIIIVILAGVAMGLVARSQRRRLQRRLRLELCNLGNVPSRFELQADDPAGLLRFAFSLEGERLPQRYRFEASQERPAAPAEQPAPAQAGGARRTARRLLGLSGVVADLLSTLAHILPYSLGEPLLRVVSRLRQGEMTAYRVEQVPRQMGRLQAPPAPARRPTAPQAAAAGPTSASTWTQTPSIGPGGTLVVDLLIRPAKAYPFQVHTFQLLSRSVEAEAADWTSTPASVEMAAPSWFRRALPFVLILLAALALLVAVFWLASAGFLG